MIKDKSDIHKHRPPHAPKKVLYTSKKENTWKFVKEFMWPRKGYIFLMFVILIFMQTYSALVPQFSRYLIEKSGTTSEAKFFTILVSVGIWLSSLLVVKAIFQFMSRFFFMVYEQKIEFELKEKIFEKTLHLDVEVFDKNNEGYFMSRINKDPWFMGQFAQNVPKNIFEGVSAFLLNISFIFMMSWEAGVVAVIVTILASYFSVKKKAKFNDNFKKLRKLEDITGKQITNDITGVREVKNYNAYDHSYANAEKAIDDVTEVQLYDVKLMASWVFSNKIFLSIITLAFTLIGAFNFIENNITLGEFTALIMYSTAIQIPINSFLALIETFNKSTVSIDKYYNFMDQEVEDEHSPLLENIDGTIKIENLDVKFGDIHVLKNLSLEIKNGEKIAIVGKTGSGKTTLLKMLMKYYKPNSGTIKLAGEDIWNHSTESVRAKITYMSQEPFISFDSIRNNIMISNEDITPEKYESVKEKSYSASFINSLPKGDETMIGPKGITLSGGQRQRLALARVFTKETPIIIFDEATSNLDNITEKGVKNSIAEFAKDKTVITIAHRLTTIKDAERIIVINEGQVVEDGTWDSLISNRAEFYQYVSLMSERGEDE